MKIKLKQILQCLLIALYIGYYFESTLFFHTHIFDWGTVTHSHPMPSGGHSHSMAQCFTIASLTNLLITVAGALFIAIVLKVLRVIYTSNLQPIARHILVNCSLRAPPVSVY